VLEHGQHSIRPCKVMSLLAVQSSAVHVRVQQSPRGAPVTDGDRCVGSVTNVISSAIMMCPPCSGRAPKSWVLCLSFHQGCERAEVARPGVHRPASLPVLSRSRSRGSHRVITACGH
jgi:hypothetical protein